MSQHFCAAGSAGLSELYNRGHRAWVPVQAGEYILSEGARLEADSRFFIIEDGAVECRKTLEVGCLMGFNRSRHTSPQDSVSFQRGCGCSLAPKLP